MVKENEGHGFRNEENRFDFYRAMEKFLGKHLGGRVEAETQDQNEIFLMAAILTFFLFNMMTLSSAVELLKIGKQAGHEIIVNVVP